MKLENNYRINIITVFSRFEIHQRVLQFVEIHQLVKNRIVQLNENIQKLSLKCKLITPASFQYHRTWEEHRLHCTEGAKCFEQLPLP